MEAFCFWSEEIGWFTAAWKGEVCPNDAGHKESIVFPVAIEALFIQFLVFLFVFWAKTDPSKTSSREIKFLSAKVAYCLWVTGKITVSNLKRTKMQMVSWNI